MPCINNYLLEVAHHEEGSSNDNEDEYRPSSEPLGDMEFKGVVGRVHGFITLQLPFLLFI